MIVNIFDLRADHMASDSLDAAVVGCDCRIDLNGVLVVDANWKEPRLRKGVSIASAIAWAVAKPEPVALLLFDGDARCSRLAELRMENKGARERILGRLAITQPLHKVVYVEEFDEPADVAAPGGRDGVAIAVHSASSANSAALQHAPAPRPLPTCWAPRSPAAALSKCD